MVSQPVGESAGRKNFFFIYNCLVGVQLIGWSADRESVDSLNGGWCLRFPNHQVARHFTAQYRNIQHLGTVRLPYQVTNNPRTSKFE
jgi:hypothetical protein